MSILSCSLKSGFVPLCRGPSFHKLLDRTSLSSSVFHKPKSTKAGRFQQNRIGILGAPLDRGQSKSGTEDGPRTCRDSGFISLLTNTLNLDVKDYGDIDFGFPKRECKAESYTPTGGTDGKPVQLKNIKEVAGANRKISEAVQKIIRDDRISLTLGGDHSIAIGSLHGSSEVYPDLGVLWVDAHADINTSLETLTGNMHGMPVAFLITELEAYMEKFPEFDWLTPRIKARNMAYIGLRDVDLCERTVIEMLGITAYSMKEVDQLGIRNVTRMALDKISPGGTRPVHLSFDIDSLDDSEIVTTGTPVAGGLTLREAHTLLEEVHNTELMVSMDLVEVNPHLGSREDVRRTVHVIRQLLTTIFGYHRGGVSRRRKLVPVA